MRAVCALDRFAEAMLVLDGEPVCAAHARDPECRGDGTSLAALAEAQFEAQFDPEIAAALAVAAPRIPELCGRGCGKPVHRGMCAGKNNYAARKAAAVRAAAASAPAKPLYLELRDEEIPGVVMLHAGQFAATGHAAP